MKLFTLLVPAAAALMLAACASNAPSHNHHGHDHGHQNGHNHDHGHNHGGKAAYNREAVFGCQNGFTVQVARADTDRIAVEYGLQDQRSRAELTAAVSGSGERYVSRDKKTTWHQKGGDGILSFADRYGNVTETVCRRK